MQAPTSTQRAAFQCNKASLDALLMEMPPNPALYSDAPGLSRSLQGKGRASPMRAGKCER